MFATKRVGWHLPLALAATTFLLFSIAVVLLTGHRSRTHTQYPDTLSTLLSPRTIRALDQDQTLQDALLSFSEVIAATSAQLGERFHSERMKTFGLNLTDATAHIRTSKQQTRRKRGLLDDLGSAFQGFIGGGGGAPGGLNLTEGLSGLFGGLGDSLVGSLATPALFLGIGLGMGASDGLNLTEPTASTAQAIKVANTYNASATGLNLVAQNLGSGLAGQIAPSLGNSNISIGPIAFALASGIGNATAYGLNLTQEQSLPSNGSDLEAVAGNLGLGITGPIVSKIDLQAVMNNVGGDGTSAIMKQLPEIAAAAGRGLGEGARDGFGLTAPSPKFKRRQQDTQDSDPLSSIDIVGTVGSFTKGLSQSFLTGSDLSKLNLTGGINNIDLQAMLRPLAAGAGAGIGMGVAVGLKLKDVDAQPTFGGNITSEDAKTALIAEGFVQNLLSNFLLNSTALEKGKELIKSDQPQLLKGVSGAKAAEGFARGAIEGIATAMSSVGGLKNLISGNVPAGAMESVPILEPSKFDDSTNGTAIGFARGFTGPGTILVAEVIRNLTGGTKDATTSTSSRKRGEEELIDEVVVASTTSLSRRQSQVTANDGSQFTLAIDSATLEMGTQKVIDLLTCQGVGGLAAAAQAVMKGSNTNLLSVGQAGAPLDNRVLQSLPSEPITITSEGNNYKIVLRELSFEVNGMEFRRFTILTALHIVFASLAFLAFIPLYIIWGVMWRFSLLSGFPINEASNKKWRIGFLVAFAVFGFVGIILGIAGMGNARHFRDAHGILGLIALILLFPGVIFSFLRLRTNIPHPQSSSFASVKAPIVVAKSPQRIYLISGVFSVLLLALGQGAFVSGFSTLRSISLCLVDAVLTSTTIAATTSMLLMLQISANTLIGIRIWLEKHIAKREAAGDAKVDTAECPKARRSSIQTFGFDRKTPPAPLNFMFKPEQNRPELMQRKTADLLGTEDGAIGTPFNVRKEGSETSPVEQVRMYNPKTAGYYEFQNARSDGSDEGDRPVRKDVSTRDLWPPPREANGRVAGAPSRGVFGDQDDQVVKLSGG